MFMLVIVPVACPRVVIARRRAMFFHALPSKRWSAMVRLGAPKPSGPSADSASEVAPKAAGATQTSAKAKVQASSKRRPPAFKASSLSAYKQAVLHAYKSKAPSAVTVMDRGGCSTRKVERGSFPEIFSRRGWLVVQVAPGSLCTE